VNLECRYTTPHDARRLSFNNNVDGNDFVDSVLRVVFEAGNSASSPTRNRKIVFSAFDPTVASFLNFKQPNYAVFFGSFCGLARSPRPTPPASASAPPSSRLEPIELAEEDDKRCLSVREAVKFAKANNLLGVMLDATLIAQVPHLIYSIKESGLILAVFCGSDGDQALGKIIARGCCGKGPPSIEGLPSVDACMSNG
jgi:CDK inhibitor PHO81